MEATMFALLAGRFNLGKTAASNLGALVLQELGVNPTGQPGESSQFDKLWLAALLSTIGPIIMAFLVPWLIPAALQTERILPDGQGAATKGSLLRRLLGKDEA